MRQADGSDLLGANDARNASIGIIYVAPYDDRPSVLEAILMQDKLGRKQIAVVLPENSRAFQRPVDFDGLKNMRRGLKAEIIFVVSGVPGPAEFARQRRFTVYTSLDSYISALRAESPDNGNAKKGLALFGRKPKLSSSDVGATSEKEQEDPYDPDHYIAQRIREAAPGGISARPLAAHQLGNRLEKGTIANQPEQLPHPQNTLGANIQSTPASSSKQPKINEPLADHPRQEVLNYAHPPKVRDENSSPEQKGPDHAQNIHHAARNISLPPAPEIAPLPQVGDKLPEKQLSKLEGVINVEPATPLAINKPAPIFEVPKTKDRSGQQFGNYRLIRLLGHGGFADVYLGQHLRLKTHAAIKVLHTHLSDTDIEDFQKEAETIANLHHPNIVRILDFDVEGDIPFLVMDHAPHGTLRGRYPKGSRLPLTIVVSYVKQVADALGYAHDQKLIHRDIKPENILLGPNDEVLLSDFGIAVVGHSSRSVHTENQAGTVYYMAPEQIQGKPRRASDQYALAVVVYEWLTGARPFTGTAIEIITQHLTTIPPSLRLKDSTIPPVVEQVIMIALAKDPDQRFARIQAFANALEKAIQLSH